MENIIGKIDILDILLQRHSPTLLVGVGVVANLMPLVQNTLVQVGIHLGILAQHEEGGLGIVAVEGLEYPLRNARRGAIVKGEVDALGVIYLPHHIGV